MQIDLIRKYNPDIIGTQEGLKEQIDYLADHLSDYVVIGEGRKGGDDDEHMAIFFRRDKFRLREMQSFQLSETPEIIGSGPEVNPRMVTRVRLAELNRFGAWTAERPVFLMGDFNCRPGSPPYKVLIGDKNSTDPDLLKNAYEDLNKIDWILYKGAVKVLKYEVVDYNVNGVYPSDHKPIYVELEILKN